MSALQPLKINPPYDPVFIVATLINKIISGHLNSVGTVTLTNGGTSTVLSDTAIKPTSKVFLRATSANAATVTGLWVDKSTITVPNGGKVTLKHSSVAAADLTFDYVVLT